MFARSLLSFGAVSAALLSANDLLAQPSDADRAAARAIAQEGQWAFNAKDYAVAAERFARADSLVHAPTLLLALARSQVQLGKLVEAHENYARILRENVAPGSPKPWTRAYEDAAKEIDAVAARLPWIVIRVTGASAPDVTIDGSPVPPAALDVRRPVNPGRHELRASAAGYKAVKRTFTIAEGKGTTIEIDLDTEPPPRTAPAAPAPAAAQPQGTTRSPWTSAGYAALGIGAAGLVVGGIAGAKFLEKRSELERSCPDSHCSPELGKTIDQYRQIGTISTVGFVAGAVGLATGAVLLLSAPSATSETGRSPAIEWAAFVQLDRAGVRGVF